MELNFFSLLILIVFCVWGFQVIRHMHSPKRFTWKLVLHYIASACVVVGAVGFFGSALSSSAGLSAPQKFEWPIGNTNSALKYTDGRMVVAHVPSGRVQIYDSALQFIHGWSVNASGGSFNLFPVDESTFYIYIARNNMKYHYDLEGNLISSQKYSERYPNDSSQLVSASIPTPIYLWVFTHSFASWFAAAFGMFLLFITGGIRVKKN